MFNFDSDLPELLFNAHIDEFHVVDKDAMFSALSEGDRNAVSMIMEAALIKHFFKEKKFNLQVVNQPLEDVAKVKTKLVKRGFTGVQVAVQLDGLFGMLGTDETGYHNRHVFRYSLQQL
ncbi:hypothetical protein Q8F57_009910 [Paraburkholderia terrae]|uniref:hypothetical protein n=1 Tax=Paraburkholderia terrae TaxID=311230 RepID=UPI00296AB351|nr:hypothetical protein [Paraburkholderia terrae]MDW3660438.1 hypothetical protein [Paraburkholderia terrae]